MKMIYFNKKVNAGLTVDTLKDLLELLEIQNSTDKYEPYSSVMTKTDNAQYDFRVDIDGDIEILGIYGGINK